MCIGCSSSYEVSSSPDAETSFDTFNVDAYDRSGTIVFQDGRELDARNIIASTDSTRFLNEKTDAITVVPTHTIKEVVFTSHGVGFLDGLEWGAGIGAVTGVTLGLLGSRSGNGAWGSDVAGISMGFGAIGAAVGGVIGGIWGGIAGHSYENQFPASTDSTKK